MFAPLLGGVGAGRFMESLHSLLRMRWDPEPTPDPSQEGNGQDAVYRLIPSWEGWGVGRFMESTAGRRRWRPCLKECER